MRYIRSGAIWKPCLRKRAPLTTWRRIMLHDIRRIARKELAGFFSSPAAFLFLGMFLAVTLFVFFWVEAFFSRNIADVRPLFEWMPVLLIFLVAALSMRAWSEERRSGTLELLATVPLSPLSLVLGKFFGGLALLLIALALTLPLAFSIAFLGPLDWGPVLGGYVAALFLAAAYLAIGLWVSVRTDNAIVALIGTVAVCGVFYLLGANALTGLLGHRGAELLALLGAGSRFDSITRGVIDLRDLYYYASIVGVFLALNLYALERLRWAGNPASATQRRHGWLVGLLAANFLAANLWLAPQGWARVDLTQGRIYSLSQTTKDYLAQLREPLLIRGYFSAQTHPLLAPLVPRVRDLLQEYAQAGGEQVRVEFIDPHRQPELEEEAGARYGIRPVPFQTASKYQASVVNSYFDILIAYGDQYETLNYRDLIDIKVRAENDIQVELKNPEYDITRAIRKTLNAYQGGGNPFDNLSQPVSFQAFVSAKEHLPQPLDSLRDELGDILAELQEKSAGKLKVQFADPDTAVDLASRLAADYGFRPMVTGLLDPNPFWFSLLLQGEGESIPVPLPAELDKAGLQRAIESALQRLSPGFLKTVAVLAPAAAPSASFGGLGATGARFEVLREILRENLRLKEADLKDGKVPADADILLLLAPEGLEQKQMFAIDQFLMQGGTVVLASAPFSANLDRGITARKVDSGLQDWLQSHGLTLQSSLVLDPDNAALPVPVERNLGGFAVQEIRMLDYPYFPSLRGEGLNADSPITAALGEVALTWASPITLDAEKNQQRQVTWLLRSSAASWTSDSMDVLPDFQRYPRFGFAPQEQRQPQLLAVALQGRFDSWFAGKDSPLLSAAAETVPAADDTVDIDAAEQASNAPPLASVIERSPESARIILFASNGFLSDETLALAGQGLGTLYTKPVELLQNALDWALDDGGLASIRSRGHFARTLMPMERGSQLFWEYLNYALALLGLLLIWLLRQRAALSAQRRYQRILEGL
jgi:ABC-2 type transport system permease protein